MEMKLFVELDRLEGQWLVLEMVGGSGSDTEAVAGKFRTGK